MTRVAKLVMLTSKTFYFLPSCQRTAQMALTLREGQVVSTAWRRWKIFCLEPHSHRCSLGQFCFKLEGDTGTVKYLVRDKWFESNVPSLFLPKGGIRIKPFVQIWSISINLQIIYCICIPKAKNQPTSIITCHLMNGSWGQGKCTIVHGMVASPENDYLQHFWITLH